jgi:uncharacterized protein (TIGR03118 family)
MRKIADRFALIALTLLFLGGTVRGEGYIQTNLVSDIPGLAQQTNPNLINPWGISFSKTSPFWVSDQGGTGPAGIGNATVYSVHGPAASPPGNGLVSGPTALTVHIPNQGGAAPSDANGPTGQVSSNAPGITTGSSDFLLPNNGPKAAFIFANMDGSISAWAGGPASTIIPSTVIAGASFTGLGIGNSGGAAFIYAADQNSGNVYKFDSTWTLKGTLTDPNLPAGFTAFNVQNLNGVLYVTYAIPNHPLNGIVDEFSTDGTFIKRLIDDSSSANPHLQTPWGLAFAPTSWGPLGGDLLVGNNDGDGTINAYKVVNNVAAWVGQVTLANGTVFHQDELWALTFGNGSGAGSQGVLYFAAGLPGATDGLFGALSIPEPGTAVLGLIAMGTLVGGRTWRNRRRTAKP